MPRRDNHQRFETEPLFELSGIYQQPVPKPFKPPGLPVWTDSKARLIERYLHYFVLVTRHGIYIDGFAGRSIGAWMSTRPNWLLNVNWNAAHLASGTFTW